MGGIQQLNSCCKPAEVFGWKKTESGCNCSPDNGSCPRSEVGALWRSWILLFWKICKKDLGILEYHRINVNHQCATAAKKALRCTGQTTIWNTESNYTLDCNTLQYKTDANKLERAYRRATKKVKSLEANSYEEHLKKLSMFILKKWRLREDMIAVFQNLKDCYREESVHLFSIALKSGRNLTEGVLNLK